MKLLRSFFILILSAVCLTSCDKYLDVRSSSSLVIPSTPEDLQSLLDNFNKMNYNGISYAESSADDYFITATDYNSITENLRRVYTWEPNNLFNSEDNDWSLTYNKIYVANVVLDNIATLDLKNYSKAQVNDIKGQALFIRSFAFFQLATTFALAYDEGTADTDPGIPLRLTSDLNERIFRPTIKQTYEQITNDLKEATTILNTIPVHPLRASRPAALALLARVYLYLNDYDKSFKYADTCLKLKSNLVSYNTPEIPNLDARYPFSAVTLVYNNTEILFVSRTAMPRLLQNATAKIDTVLMSQYKAGDNRKRVLFLQGTGVNSKYYSFKGSYDGSLNLFDGIATDEVYLMRAESAARLNRISDAMNDLNTLLKKRWDKTVTYVDLTANNSAEAVDIILAERRKSLVMRSLRWIDIKRLNAAGANIPLKRKINGTEYQLPPKDLRYAIAIPETIIKQSGMAQNKR